MVFILVFFAGAIAGFLNVVAGGGSMITLPMLTTLGMGIDVANGTNRIAILLQNLVAIHRFKKKNLLNMKRAFLLSIPTLLGAILGSFIAIQIERNLLERVVGIMLLTMAVFLVWKPKLWLEERKSSENVFLKALIFFLIGIYGGFIQAGVGFLLILGITLMEGTDLVKTNAIKVFIVAVYTVFSLLIFLIGRKVDLLAGTVLSLGNMTGAALGAKFAVEKGSNWIRWIVFFAVVISSIRYIF